MMKSTAAYARDPALANNWPARSDRAAERSSRAPTSSRRCSARSRCRATDSSTSGWSASSSIIQSARRSCNPLSSLERPRYAASKTSACAKRHRPPASSSGCRRPFLSSEAIALSTSSGSPPRRGRGAPRYGTGDLRPTRARGSDAARDRVDRASRQEGPAGSRGSRRRRRPTPPTGRSRGAPDPRASP